MGPDLTARIMEVVARIRAEQDARLGPVTPAPPTPPAPVPTLIVCLCPPRRHGEAFVPCALHALCGQPPDPTSLAELDAEVRRAIAQYRCEVACGVLGPGPLRVRGRPVSDYLDLDTLGRLIMLRLTLAEDAAGG
jgi:hypothetical protein